MRVPVIELKCPTCGLSRIERESADKAFGIRKNDHQAQFYYVIEINLCRTCTRRSAQQEADAQLDSLVQNTLTLV